MARRNGVASLENMALATNMRITFDIPSRLTQRFLDYITDPGPKCEIIINVRLRQRRGESQPPHVVWEVEPLPNNGGIYRLLLKEAKNHESQGNIAGEY